MQTRSDDLIRSDVLFELKWDPKISSSSDIAVAVKDGVVTLTGFVHSYWDKDAAEKAVKRVYGVRGVANDIEVKLSSRDSQSDACAQENGAAQQRRTEPKIYRTYRAVAANASK